MSWDDIMRFGDEHELCHGRLQLKAVGPAGEGVRLSARCTGCGVAMVTNVENDSRAGDLAPLFDALSPELAAMVELPSTVDTDEARAALFEAVENEPSLRRLMEALIGRAKREPKR